MHWQAEMICRISEPSASDAISPTTQTTRKPDAGDNRRSSAKYHRLLLPSDDVETNFISRAHLFSSPKCASSLVFSALLPLSQCCYARRAGAQQCLRAAVQWTAPSSELKGQPRDQHIKSIPVITNSRRFDNFTQRGWPCGRVSLQLLHQESRIEIYRHRAL